VVEDTFLVTEVPSPPGSAQRLAAGPPTMTVTVAGDLATVVVRDVNDYCATNGVFHGAVRFDGIHVLREKPTTVTRCMQVRDFTFKLALAGIHRGQYVVVYEQMPYGSAGGPVEIARGSLTLLP
jgi:3-mercaptopyruvate sulfurtransferase SseA